jgi:hypothetical protein
MFTLPLPPLLVILDSIPREHYASAFSVGYSKIPISLGCYDVHHIITFIPPGGYGVHSASASSVGYSRFYTAGTLCLCLFCWLF